MATPDPNCVFCRIASGELSSLKVLDGPELMAFLDVGPLAQAHLLLIPKRHHARLEEMPAAELAELTKVLPGLARAVMQASGCRAYNVLQNNGAAAGQAVGHVHFHLIPRRDGDGLGYRWNAGKYEPGRAEVVQAAILQALRAPQHSG